MLNQVQVILRKAACKKDGQLIILSHPTHERWQNSLAQAGNTHILLRGQNIKDWDSTYAPLPPNHVVVDEIPIWATPDLILCQNKFGQYPVDIRLSRQLNLPLIVIEHTLPVPSWSPVQLSELKRMRGDVNVFISHQSREKWGWKEDEAIVVKHGVNTEIFKPVAVRPPTKRYALSICNDWVNRDWCCGFNIWRNATGFPNQEHVPVRVLGKTPGLSQPATSIENLVEEYNGCAVFLNTSTHSPIPSVVLEAMACGKPVVTTDNYVMSEIIVNGVNGYKSNDPLVLRKYCMDLINDEAKAKELGVNARNTVLKEFGLPAFVENWKRIFRSVL